jgi:hypothetical protein
MRGGFAKLRRGSGLIGRIGLNAVIISSEDVESVSESVSVSSEVEVEDLDIPESESEVPCRGFACVRSSNTPKPRS